MTSVPVTAVKRITARVVSVHVGSAGELHKDERAMIEVELDGIVGDRHRSWERSTWAGDKQPAGSVRRNERQWSAVSVEELKDIGDAMNLAEPLTAASLGANLCLEGVAELSRLPKGSLLRFPSGAELVVEEFNPPCLGMGRKLAAEHSTRSGREIDSTAFSRAAKFMRGIVGVVEVAGTISAGDEVSVEIYRTPSWLARSGG